MGTKSLDMPIGFDLKNTKQDKYITKPGKHENLFHKLVSYGYINFTYIYQY